MVTVVVAASEGTLSMGNKQNKMDVKAMATVVSCPRKKGCMI